MQTAEILHAIHDHRIALQEAKAGTLDALATQLLSIRQYYDAMISHIQLGKAETALDLDFRIDDELALVKRVIREIYRKSFSIEDLRQAAKLSYASATNLQWEIGEHDIAFSPPKSGYTASSIEELNEVLDRIESEE